MGVICKLAHTLSQKCRKRIEEIFGWAKTTGCFGKSRYHGVERTHAQGQYVVAACNLVRMAKLICSPHRRNPRERDAPGGRGRSVPAHCEVAAKPTRTAPKTARKQSAACVYIKITKNLPSPLKTPHSSAVC